MSGISNSELAERILAPPAKPPRRDEKFHLNAWGFHSPKLNRWVQLYRDLHYQYAVLLEADASIPCYRELPLTLSLRVNGRTVRHELHLAVRASDGRIEIPRLLYDDADTNDEVIAAERDWVHSVGFRSRIVTAREIRRHPMFLSNWVNILRYLSAVRHRDTSGIEASVLDVCHAGVRTIGEVERTFITHPTLVRAAIFRLIHRGQLLSPGIETTALSAHSVLEVRHAS